MSALYSCLKGKNDAIMAANPSEGAQTVMPEEPHEECPGKKKSKFKAFKKLFVKKKRKESTAPIKESNLKPSQSSSDVSGSGAKTTAFDADQESVSKGNMGSKAVSHDSVFISEMESLVKEDISQECTPGKVKALQLQLQQNIRIGSPPQGIVPKKLEDSGTLSEDDGLPRSPPEITSLHEILARSSRKSPISARRRNSISLGGTDSEDEPESSELSSRPTSPSHSNVLLCPTSPVRPFPLADFTTPASSVSCLDNSAAKHKILVKPKKRRPPIMNVKPTQGTNRTSKPAQTKKGEENDIMVEEQLFEIPDLDKCSVHEASSEDVKIAEDVLQKPEEDMVVSVCEPQMDVSELNSKTDNTSLILEVPLLENQIVSFQNEAVCSETDVDFNECLVSTGDRVDIAEEELERDEVILPPQAYDFQPAIENEITITMIPSEISSVEMPEGNAIQIENPNLNTSQYLVCGSLGNYEPNLEEAIATAVSVIKDEDEYNELGTILPDKQNDLLNVSESVLVETETLENCVLSIQTVTSIIKDDDVQEVQVACECDRPHESNEKQLDTVGIQNTEAILEVSDQLVANNEGKNENLLSEQKTETSDLSVTEVNDYKSGVDNVPDSKAPVVINDSSYPKVTTNAHDFGIFANGETSAEIGKDIKASEPIPDSNVKGSNKPVRFTVAPAWQRALSSGPSVKDSSFTKNAVGNLIRSGSLDSADESVVQSSSAKKNVQKDQEDSCGHFGVRLRRTSSSIKYNEEDVSTEDSSPVDSSSLPPGKSLQTPKRTMFSVDCSKMSKTSNNEEKVTPEVRSQPKADHSSQENREPAWITMAKLKQKGFHDHPLARGQSSAAGKNEKVKETECIQKKNIATSHQVVEEKRSEQAAADSPAAQEVAKPDSEKSIPSTQPQNPEEPPWFVLAKKKAKAWSEMPEIVQQ